MNHRKQSRIAQVLNLHSKGLTCRQIGLCLKIHYSTVSRIIKEGRKSAAQASVPQASISPSNQTSPFSYYTAKEFAEMVKNQENKPARRLTPEEWRKPRWFPGCGLPKPD